MKETILLVDDEQGIRTVMGLSLRDAGYNVITVASGEEALQLFAERPIPIVITDIRMPGMNGLDLLKHIKILAPETEVILISGHADLEMAIQGLKLEASDFITKPIDDDLLHISLKRALERIAMRNKLKEYTSNLEKMILNKNLLCRKYTTPNRPHSHNMWELIFFEKGETANTVNDVEYTANPGDVFLIGPPHTHAITFRSTPHLHRDLYYTDESVREVAAMFSEDLYDKLCSDDILHFHMSSNTFQTIIRQSEKLESLAVLASMDNGGITNDELKKISISVLHFVIGLSQIKTISATPSYPKWLLDIIQRLSLPEYFTKSVEDIVSETYYSHATVSNIFREYLGVTLSEYLINLRLEHAAELLTNTSKSTLEICSAVGYDSLSYFIKQFKKKFGVTPHKYRLNTKKNQ